MTQISSAPKLTRRTHTEGNGSRRRRPDPQPLRSPPQLGARGGAGRGFRAERFRAHRS